MIVILSLWEHRANRLLSRRALLVAFPLAATVAGCDGAANASSRAEDAAPDSVRMERQRPPVVLGRPHALPPLADTIAGRLVFAPTTQPSFVVVFQQRRLLMDLGRVDDNVTRSPERLEAYRIAVQARSPLAKGSLVRVRGPWGPPADVSIDSFDVASGRIVAVLGTVPAIAAATEQPAPLVGLAERTPPEDGDQPSATTLPADSAWQQPQPSSGQLPDSTACARGWSDGTRARATAVRDSLERALRAGEAPVYARLRSSLKARRSMTPGCFRDGPAVIAVALYGGDYEWVREKVVLLTRGGGVRPLSVRDYRMRAHELIGAFDADADGFDDIAARGYATRAGAQVVLRLTGNRLERIASGFAWER